ncbi:MAG: accessory gene regulator B family protein [Alphaproteobacteria bacterium]|nr:accessory gene regulator B family protein [Alphaproteobacteria bacterium]
MISKLSERIAVGLKQSSIIEEDDVELYAYGFYILISKLLFLIIALILGVILNIVFESIVFYVSFSIIRAYAGGVHANKEWKCFLYTSISIVMCALGIKVLINLKPTVFFAVILMISSLIIIIISPLDTKEKPLSAKEKEKYYMISAIVLLSYILVILLLAKLGIMKVCYAIMIAIFLESILLMAGLVQNREVNS